MKTLNNAFEEKDNNVSLVKLAAAWLVIAGHAFAFACNYEKTDIMSKLSRGTYNLGGFAVAVFFFFSGLFIMKSLNSGKLSTAEYFKRRIKRIFPPFIKITAAIIVISGIFFTSLPVKDYFTNVNTYKYMLNCIFVPVHYLPGVFENNISGAVVNGPIWTIKVEVICYIIAYLLYRLHLTAKKSFQYIVLLFIVAAGIIYFGNTPLSKLAVLVRPAGMFLAGMMYCIYSEYIKLDIYGMLTAAIIYIILMAAGLPELALFIALPYFICCVSFLFKALKSVKVIQSAKNSTYEIYLWGGFTGQAVTAVYGGYMSPWTNMAVTIIIATIAGILTKNTERLRK